MRKESRSFIETILPILVAVIIGTILYRRLGLKLPGIEHAQTVEEKVEDTLGELNARERGAGRAPFVLTRVVGPGSVSAVREI